MHPQTYEAYLTAIQIGVLSARTDQSTNDAIDTEHWIDNEISKLNAVARALPKDQRDPYTAHTTRALIETDEARCRRIEHLSLTLCANMYETASPI